MVTGGRFHFALGDSNMYMTATACRILLLTLGLMITGASRADETTKTMKVKLPDGETITITVTSTDADGDGKPEKVVREERDGKGRLVARITDSDEYGDGRAERSVTENFADPSKAEPSTRIKRTRKETDSNWRAVVTDTDSDQDGNVEERTTAHSKKGDGRFDVFKKESDDNDNGQVEKVERLLADPGGDAYRIKETRTFDDTTGKEKGSANREKGKFGPVKKSEDSPDLPTSSRRGAGILEGTGQVVANSESRSFHFLAIPSFLGGRQFAEDPIAEPALPSVLLVPPFTFSGPQTLVSDHTSRVSLTDGDQVFLSGSVPELTIIDPQDGPGSLDPIANVAFLGDFDLSTLALAGVPSSSPFFDPTLSSLASPGILGMNDLLDPGSSHFAEGSALRFRFDAIADLRGSNGEITPDGSSFGIASLRVTHVPEPTALALLGAGLIGFAGCRRRRAATGAGDATSPSAAWTRSDSFECRRSDYIGRVHRKLGAGPAQS